MPALPDLTFPVHTQLFQRGFGERGHSGEGGSCYFTLLFPLSPFLFFSLALRKDTKFLGPSEISSSTYIFSVLCDTYL